MKRQMTDAKSIKVELTGIVIVEVRGRSGLVVVGGAVGAIAVVLAIVSGRVLVVVRGQQMSVAILEAVAGEAARVHEQGALVIELFEFLLVEEHGAVEIVE